MAEPLINIKADGAGENNGSSAPKIDLGAGGSGPGNEADQSFENIFSKPAAKEKGSKIVATIIAQKDELKNLKPILGPAPTLEKAVEQDKESRLKRKLRTMQFAFLIVFAVSLGMVGYFYSQLSPSFAFGGANVTQRLTDLNGLLKNKQAAFNKYRYLAGQVYLNDFSYQADRFFGNISRLNDPTMTAHDKAKLLANVDDAEKNLPVLLQNIRGNLNQSLVVPTYPMEGEAQQTDDEIQAKAQQDLRDLLTADRSKIPANSTNPDDVQNLKLINSTLNLVGNKGLLNALQNSNNDDFKKDLATFRTNGDAQTEKKLRDFIGKILASTKSDLSIIADVKQKRIGWSTVIARIEAETTNVDKNYGQPLLYENLGGIVYSGYEFDASTNKIVLSGSTKTIDGSNFTLMSNLIDQLEQSPYFKDVDMRSFTKNKTANGTSTEGYVMNFKIALRLQAEQFSSKDKAILLDQNKTTETGVKRTTSTTTQQTP